MFLWFARLTVSSHDTCGTFKEQEAAVQKHDTHYFASLLLLSLMFTVLTFWDPAIVSSVPVGLSTYSTLDSTTLLMILPPTVHDMFFKIWREDVSHAAFDVACILTVQRVQYSYHTVEETVAHYYFKFKVTSKSRRRPFLRRNLLCRVQVGLVIRRLPREFSTGTELFFF
jgi:hypothetical protein